MDARVKPSVLKVTNMIKYVILQNKNPNIETGKSDLYVFGKVSLSEYSFYFDWFPINRNLTSGKTSLTNKFSLVIFDNRDDAQIFINLMFKGTQSFTYGIDVDKYKTCYYMNLKSEEGDNDNE